MPKKKRKKGSKKPKKNIKKILLLFILFPIVLFLVIVFFCLLIKSLNYTKNQNLNYFQSTYPSFTEIFSQKNEPTDRDLLSENDITKEIEADILRQELMAYFDDNEIYPPILYNLEPDYIENLEKEFEYFNKFIYSVSNNRENFELNIKLSPNGNALMANDNGNNDQMYEIGTDLTLIE